jgi:hypothetical protein
MLKSLKCLKLSAFALLLTAPCANADQLFTSFSGGVVAGQLWSGGGPCAYANCDAFEQSFSNPVAWDVTKIDFYIQAYAAVVSSTSGWRYALFDAESGGNEIVPPTDAGAAIAFTDTTIQGGNGTKIYQGVLTGLNINLPPGTYWFRLTNTGPNGQQSLSAEGASQSSQYLNPGLVLLTGSSTVEALLATNPYETGVNWAFDVYGIGDRIFAGSFEGP